MPLKVLHLADLHLRDQDINEALKCLDFIHQSSIDERPDLAIIAGDMFDSRAVRLDSTAAKTAFNFVSKLADICPVAVLIGTPSHDGMAAEVLAHVRGAFQVYVSARPEQVILTDTTKVFLPVDGMVGFPDDAPCIKALLSFVPTPTKQFFQSDGSIDAANAEIGAAMGGIFAGFGVTAQACGNPPHILVGHFQVGGAFVSETQQLTGVDIEISRQQIEMAGADIVCLGHIHLHQQIGTNIFYSGSIYRKDFGELDSKGIYYHEIGGESRFVETPTRKLVKLEADTTKGEFVPVGPVGPDIVGAFVRLIIKVWADEAANINRTEIADEFRMCGAADADIRIVRVPRETVRSERILKLASLRDKLAEMAGIKGEAVLASILEKADLLESTPSEDILKSVGLPY